MIVILDSGPLGLLATTNGKNERAKECYAWIGGLLENSIPVYIPEICDYEVRRELLRIGSSAGIRRLTYLRGVKGIKYLPINTEIMLKACELWAEARKKGRITCDSQALDGDVILAATALSLPSEESFVVATTNLKHLEWFVPSKIWSGITTESCLSANHKISIQLEVR